MIKLWHAVVICGKCNDKPRVCCSNLVGAMIHLGCAIVIYGKCSEELRVHCSNLY